MRSFAAVSVLAALSACAVPVRTTVSPNALLEGVKKAEVERDALSPAIARALGAQQRELRIAALRALARTGEVGTASSAIPLLGDRDEEVATWAAFALGELAEPAGEAALLASLKDISPVPDRVLFALGRAGTATAAQDLAATMLHDARPRVRAAAALAIGLIAKRLTADVQKLKLEKKIAPLVKDPDRDVRFGAVYALMRIQGTGSSVALIPALADRDPEIRANAARGMGLGKAAPQVLDVVIRDPDWRVRVEVVRALGAIAKTSKDDVDAVATRLVSIADRELASLKGVDLLGSGVATHVLLALAEQATALGPDGHRVIALLEKTPWEKSDQFGPATASDLARLACAVAFARDRAEGVVRRVRSCGDATMPAWRREALAARLYAEEGSAKSVAALIAMTGHADPRVRTAGVDALASLAPEAQGLKLSIDGLTRMLDSNDPYVAAAAGDALARKDVSALRPRDLGARLSRSLETAVAQNDAGIAVGILDAIGALGKDATPLLPKLESLANDPRAAIRRRAAAARAAITGTAVRFGSGSEALLDPKPLPIAKKVRLVFRTVRGPIVAELDGESAPETAGTLAQLASTGYYNDRVFHRIVSDFVAQGGCPRGDGWGGPGYTIADEISPAPFTRGAVGIATSGRDTGGSQFFFMHAYHPHLDGAYASVGRVVSGMEVVDALQPDDRILEVRVEE